MRAADLKYLLGFCFSLIACVQAYAQPLFGRTESIESTVANADLVFIATLVDFRLADQGYDRDGHEATIVIEETLKREPFYEEPYRGLSLHIPRPASVLADWKEHASRLLIAYDNYALKQTAVIDLMPDKLEVMTADVTLIRDPETAIELARQAVHRLPANIKRVHTFDLQVPRAIITGTRWESYYNTGGHLLLSVPVDQHLEKRAQDSVRSDNPHLRAEGVRALAYFKSEENIALVKPLLNDQGITYSDPAYQGTPGERIYGVRHAAYETLKSWQIDVEKPVYREKMR